MPRFVPDDVPYCAPCVGLSLYSEWNDVNHHRGARTGADGNQNYNGRACAPYSDGASTTSCGKAPQAERGIRRRRQDTAACVAAVVDADGGGDDTDGGDDGVSGTGIDDIGIDNSGYGSCSGGFDSCDYSGSRYGSNSGSGSGNGPRGGTQSVYHKPRFGDAIAGGDDEGVHTYTTAVVDTDC